MQFLLKLPIVRTLHERQLLFPAVLALVVAGVLAQGLLGQDGPAQAAQESGLSAPPPIPEIPRFVGRADLEKTPLTYVSDYWAQLADEARPSLVQVGPTGAPGLVVGPRLVLTTAAAAEAEMAAQWRQTLVDDLTSVLAEPDEDDQNAEPDENDEPDADDEADPAGPPVEPDPSPVRALDAELGLALFDIDGGRQTAFTLADPQSLTSGSYLGAVTLGADGETTITPGYLVAAGRSARSSAGDGADLVVSMALPAELAIAGIINLDGSLVGVAFRGPGGTRVVSTTEMLGLVARLQTRSACRSLDVSDIGPEVRELLDVEEVGVLIERVRTDAFDPEPSLRAGDVLLEWAGEPVTDVARFVELYDDQTPGALVRYRVLRNRRRLAGGTVVPDSACRPVQAEPLRLGALGLAVLWADGAGAESGWRVVAAAPDGRGAAAGVETDDWLVSIDGAPLSGDDDGRGLERAAGRERSMLLGVRRADRVKLLAVASAAE